MENKNDHQPRPPIGVYPEILWLETTQLLIGRNGGMNEQKIVLDRLQEIAIAADKYKELGFCYPVKWDHEFVEANRMLKTMRYADKYIDLNIPVISLTDNIYSFNLAYQN